MPRRILVHTSEPLGSRMAGPAIRAWHMAEALAEEFEVTLVSKAPGDATHGRFRIEADSQESVEALLEESDVVVFQGGLLRDHPAVGRSDKAVVADVYDPFHLENLERTGRSDADRDATVSHLAGVLNEQLLRADALLCASEAQRRFWLGALASLGRVNPAIYDSDPAYDSFIRVVPFGIPARPAARTRPALRGVVPGIGEGDAVVLWAGGVYDWLDPLTVLQAVDLLREDIPRLRLVFMGMAHPNPAVPEMRVAAELRAAAADLGVEGTHVFFLEGWVPYEDRVNFLLDADVGVTAHAEHVETALSFRTRVLDYLWAGLPVVTSAGDEFARVVAEQDLGAVVPCGDHVAMAEALAGLLTDAGRTARCRSRVALARDRYLWPAVLAPVVDLCRTVERAADARSGRVLRPSPPFAAVPAGEPGSRTWLGPFRRAAGRG